MKPIGDGVESRIPASFLRFVELDEVLLDDVLDLVFEPEVPEFVVDVPDDLDAAVFCA